MTSMNVIEIVEPGGPSVLKSSVRSIPKPKRNEILIKISYAGINRPDVLQRSGSYLPPPGASDLPGLEASGIIFAIGKMLLIGKLVMKCVHFCQVAVMLNTQ